MLERTVTPAEVAYRAGGLKGLNDRMDFETDEAAARLQEALADAAGGAGFLPEAFETEAAPVINAEPRPSQSLRDIFMEELVRRTIGATTITSMAVNAVPAAIGTWRRRSESRLPAP